MVLDWEERVQLSWLPDTQGVTLRHSVATHGYIGLGFGPGADIMLAWVGHVHVTDRHAVQLRWVTMCHTWTRARTITYSEEDPGEGSPPPSVSQPHPERPEEHLLVRAPRPLTRTGT